MDTLYVEEIHCRDSELNLYSCSTNLCFLNFGKTLKSFRKKLSKGQGPGSVVFLKDSILAFSNWLVLDK